MNESIGHNEHNSIIDEIFDSRLSDSRLEHQQDADVKVGALTEMVIVLVNQLQIMKEDLVDSDGDMAVRIVEDITVMEDHLREILNRGGRPS